VDCGAATTRSEEDKRKVDNFISSSVGHKELDRVITKAIHECAQA
jgi:hypothetical protein